MIHTELHTEHGQRTLDFKKDKKPPHNQGGKRKKRIRIRPVLLGGNCKGRNIPAPWEVSSPLRRSTWIEGELQGLSKRREQQTVKNNLHRRLTPPHCDPNLRYSSVSGGGGWVLKLRLQSSGPGKGPEISMETTWRGQLWELRVCYEEVWACQRGKLPLLGDTWREGWNQHKSFFSCECSQATGQHQRELQGLAWISTAILGSRGGHWIPLLNP